MTFTRIQTLSIHNFPVFVLLLEHLEKMPVPSVVDPTYECIIHAIAHNINVFGKWPAGTDMTKEAKKLFPNEFWRSFTTFPSVNTQTIEFTEDIYLELIKESGNVFAYLKFKIINGKPIILAEWLD